MRDVVRTTCCALGSEQSHHTVLWDIDRATMPCFGMMTGLPYRAAGSPFPTKGAAYGPHHTRNQKLLDEAEGPKYTSSGELRNKQGTG